MSKTRLRRAVIHSAVILKLRSLFVQDLFFGWELPEFWEVLLWMQPMDYEFLFQLLISIAIVLLLGFMLIWHRPARP